MKRRIFAALSAAVILLAATSCTKVTATVSSVPQTPEPSVPETPAPETSAPETSAPKTSDPETSAPKTSVTTPATTVDTTQTEDTSNYKPDFDINSVNFIEGNRKGNPAIVELALKQVGNVGGEPYWSWYGFEERIEWCGCFTSWCLNQVGKDEPYFTRCQSEGATWFIEHDSWGDRDYPDPAPGDLIFFDWDLDESADHVGFYIGTDGTYFYTVEGNAEDVCKLKRRPWSYKWLFGFGLMEWSEENYTVKPQETDAPAESTSSSQPEQE